MRANREETYHLLEISRHGKTTASKPLLSALLGRGIAARVEKPGGGVYVDRYRLTDAGMDVLLDSEHFDAARIRLDAERRDDGEDSQEMEL